MEQTQQNVQSQEIVQPEPSATQEVQTQSTPTPSQPEQERNFRALRESKEKAERERDELLRQMQEMQKSQVPTESKEEGMSLAPDDLVEWRHMEKKFNELQDQIKSYQQQSSFSSAEAKLKMQYPDFDQVVTKENVELLKQTEPEMASSLLAGSDIYAKGISAYKLIKNLGLYKEDKYAQDRQMAAENAAKPRSTASVGVQSGQTPLSQANAFANGLTPDLRKQLLKEMNESRKSY